VPVFLRGFIIGFSIAAPVGPIGLLCIRRSLADGRAAGFVSGLGAATADAAYGFVAAFGLTAISSALVAQQLWLRIVGGLFLCYLGARTLATPPASAAGAAAAAGARAARQGLLWAYASTLFLTLTNPMTILSFAAIFAGLGLVGSAPDHGSAADYASATLMVAGVFLGSAAWWLVLSTGASSLRARTTPAGLVWVNRVSGAVITAFGLLALLAALRTGR
jgi:threonine/homoserine/homoserine lactone efflux protein